MHTSLALLANACLILEFAGSEFVFSSHSLTYFNSSLAKGVSNTVLLCSFCLILSCFYNVQSTYCLKWMYIFSLCKFSLFIDKFNLVVNERIKKINN